MKLNPKIIEFLAPNKKDVTRILSAIKRYDRIALFRHEKPETPKKPDFLLNI